MTYRQMRALFACLARYDGRLSVLAARSQDPWTQWGVCLCDHVRQTWRCIGWREPFTEQGRVLGARDRPLAELRALPALPEPHGAMMLWPDVLRALDLLEPGRSGWLLAAITATRPARGTPCYRLVVRNDAGRIQHEVDSGAAFEHIVSLLPKR
jgi:hypothetical protein